MDKAKWERTMMQGHLSTSPNWFPRPKLEIPNVEPTTPRRQQGTTSAQSPRGIYDFPISPQSPSEGMVLSPPIIKPTPIKTISNLKWVPQDNYIDLVPNCTQFSPKGNHPGHGFGDCNGQCNNSNNNGSNNNIKNLENKSYLIPSLNYEDNVLVRCNQSKWLGGQVKRISNTSIKVWIGAAKTLVDIPIELFPTHLARMEYTSPCSSPNECHGTRFYPIQQQIKTRVHCVRPAHLSHRHLFLVSPKNSMNNISQQSCYSQCSSPSSIKPTTKCGNNCHCFTSTSASNPPNLFEHFTYLEKKGIVPPKPPILQQPRNSVEQQNVTKVESNLQEALLDAHREFANLQAQYNWRLHMAQRNQQGNRPSYPQSSTLPVLNVNLNNEGTPSSNSPSNHGRNINNYQQVKTFPPGGFEHPCNINQELPPTHASSSEDSCQSTLLYKPHYKQFVAPQMMTKSTMTNFGDAKNFKRPPTPPPQVMLTKGTMDLRDSKSPKRPPTPPSYNFKGKETCEDQACPSWTKGTDFSQISESSNHGMPFEWSMSNKDNNSKEALISSPPTKPPRNATSATTAPVWMTVIDNRHNTRKS